MQLRDVVQHLVLLDIDGVFLHRLHDCGIIVDLIFCVFTSVTRTKRHISTLYVHLDLIFHPFDLHYLPFESRIFFHIVAVDAIKLSKNRNFKIVDVVFHLSLQTIDRLTYFEFFALN